MSERRCKRCEQTLPLSAFNRHKDGHQWWCRECFRAYFKERGDLHLRQVETSKRSRVQRARDHVLIHLRSHGCVDCAQRDLVVLEFDHVRGKTREVAAMVCAGASLAAIDAEIAKCEVVCANCHRIRTYFRRGCKRGPDADLSRQKPFVQRNLRWLYELMSETGCDRCGTFDVRVLEFHHLGEKRGGVMTMAWAGFGKATIWHEVTQCTVLCANCHRRETAERGGHFRYKHVQAGLTN